MTASRSDGAPLARRIYERSHLTGEFRLRSGTTSNEYFDKYLFESDPQLVREIAETLARLLPEGVDAVAGLELGGVPTASAMKEPSPATGEHAAWSQPGNSAGSFRHEARALGPVLRQLAAVQLARRFGTVGDVSRDGLAPP